MTPRSGVTRMVAILLTGSLAGSARLEAQQASPTRLVVLNLESQSVQGSVREMFGGDQDVGKGIADLIASKLAPSHAYDVVDRGDVTKAMVAQGAVAALRPEVAQRICQAVHGAAVVLGSVTEFSGKGGGGGPM